MYNFQEMIARLAQFWQQHGCAISAPYDLEKGAGTSNPATFFRCLGPEPYRAAYIEPCRRPKDGRFGENPMRMQHYFQYQVILKPSPVDIQDLYLKSLEAIGFDLSNYDIRFVHDDWEQPTLGAWGLGWEVWIDGMESSQFTYFQAMAEIPLKPVTGELTYGLERLAMHLQKKDNFTEIQWNDELTYGDIYLENEKQWTTYNFDALDPEMMLKDFEDYKAEAKRLVELNLPLPAYDFVLKSSHTFNLLDARGVISVSERASYIAAIRELARLVAESYLENRKKQNYPLLNKWTKFAYKEEAAKAEEAYKPISKPTTTFLLEVGSEELPASFVMSGLASLERQLKALLEKEGLTFSSIKQYGTPRRLALLVQDLTVKTSPKEVEKKGPSVDVAFNEKGQPTQVGIGFLKSMNIAEDTTLDAIRQNKVPGIEIRTLKGDYLFGKQKIGAVEAYHILQKSLSSIILGVEFPKKMRWADFDISYARPIRWIVALLDDQVIPFTAGPITSGRTSYGHRQLSREAFAIKNANEYIDSLRNHHVLADQEERMKSIREQLAALEKDCNGIAQVKERVAHEVVHLVEKPFLTLGEFDQNFLKAPKEVLISEMVEHQKYFPMANSDGTLKNKFIITANVPPTDSIRHGNRKVLSARLSDGVFLFAEDLKQPLENFNNILKNVIFQKGLGSVWDKVERLKSHVAMLEPYVKNANLDKTLEAASLAKADLATEMVGEFPELQGQMGRIYAMEQGRDEKVALAIDEHWMPRGEKAPLPQTDEGALLSIAEKIDNLLGFFGLDLKPTSSSDPFALRRQALGLVRIVLDKKIPLHLKNALTACLQNFPEAIRKKQEDLVQEVISYIILRAKGALSDLGFPKDEIEACFSIRQDDINDVRTRLEALHSFRQKQNNFSKLVEVHKRCQGQINGYSQVSFTQDLLKEAPEKELYSQYVSRKNSFSDAIKDQEYAKALTLLGELQPSLGELFEKVKILDDNESLRTNRLALLQQVASLFGQIADFQKIQSS